MIRASVRARPRRSLVPRAVLSVLPLVLAPACAGEVGDVEGADGPLGVAEQAVKCILIERSAGSPSAVVDAAIIHDVLDPTKSITSFGATPQVTVGRSLTTERGLLLRFAFDGVPDGSTILYAALQLRMVSAKGGAGPEVHPVTQPWDESSVTWSTFASAPGGGFDSDLIGAVPTKGAPANSAVILDVTQLVQRWVDGTTPNHGVLVAQPAGGRTTFGTAESVTPGPRPKLSVCYQPPPS
jgi:hypothetical protein